MGKSQHPILNNPFVEPDRHWRLDERFKQTDEVSPGRRPSGAYLTVPATKKGDPPTSSCEEQQPHPMINRIRTEVGRWRTAGWPGVAGPVRRLLEHWARENTSEIRPFFAQREAVETVIWLEDSGTAEARTAQEELARVNTTFNGDLRRLCIKMATGTGKTKVMAMLRLWEAKRPNGCTDILILCPNTTIRERLQELHELETHHRELLPPGMDWGDLPTLTITNWHQCQPKDLMAISGEGDKPTGVARQLLAGGRRKDGKPIQHRRMESKRQMARRILGGIRSGQRVLVLNDEGHHCHRQAMTVGRDKEEKEQNTVWYGMLEALREAGLLDRVVDLSATPSWRKRPEGCEHQEAMFPWTVSDYPLIEAVEAGLTKIPLAPVEDDAEARELVVYRNVYRAVKERLRKQPKLDSANLPQEVMDSLARMQERYKARLAETPDGEKPPVMILVCDTTDNANAVYRYLAGTMEGERGRQGQWCVFSNVNGQGKVKAQPPTLLKHSKTSESDEVGGTSKAGMLQREFFPPPGIGEPKAKECNAHIDQVFATIGKDEGPGAHIRCVVSVEQLTEGWDVRTVTHVWGFRAFESQLLCEQVAGRSLRRTEFPSLGPDGTYPPEYAVICGIPFDWMPNGGNEDPPNPETWKIRSLKEREACRITWPVVTGYGIEHEGERLMFDPNAVEPWKAGPKLQPTRVEWAGMIGEGFETMSPAARETRVVYAIAKGMLLQTKKWGDSEAEYDRAKRFGNYVELVKEYLAHPQVRLGEDGIAGLVYRAKNEQVALNVLQATKSRGQGEARLVPLCHEKHRTEDTSGRQFKTRLSNRYPKDKRRKTQRSELNAAACHSAPETALAAVLDTHPLVEGWVRNYRLGWTIPYLDPDNDGAWRHYEPDFVARREDPEGRHTLVIEFKGKADARRMRDADAKALAAKQWWCKGLNESAAPEHAGRWSYLKLDTLANAEKAITQAFQGGRR